MLRILLQRKYPVGCKFNSVRFNNLFPKLNSATLDCLSPVRLHLAQLFVYLQLLLVNINNTFIIKIFDGL